MTAADRVALDELGVADVAEVAGFRVEADWRGDPSLSRVDAGKLLAERRRRTDESSAETLRLQETAERWLAERAAVGRAAQAEVLRGRAGSPELYARGRRAYAEAAVKFQDKHPHPAGVNPGQLIEVGDVAEMSV